MNCTFTDGMIFTLLRIHLQQPSTLDVGMDSDLRASLREAELLEDGKVAARGEMVISKLRITFATLETG
jgi:hypothetical protein